MGEIRWIGRIGKVDILNGVNKEEKEDDNQNHLEKHRIKMT